MNKKTLTVIIPSRAQACRNIFLERAERSIRNQSIINDLDLTVLVGLDAGDVLDAGLVAMLGIGSVESHGASQAAALNAAIRTVNSEYVAFLEDDDEWLPHYLAVALQTMTMAAFVSSTQLEFDENNKVLRINDFPTPSGWLMSTAALKSIGEFNENYRFHLDNEWLGRLCEAGLARVHLVEATAPVDINYMQQVRPWLANVVKNSSARTKIVRHDGYIPLVRRLRHSMSGMQQIALDSALGEISKHEKKLLTERFGRVPW